MAVEKGNKNAKEILFRTGFDHLARAGSEQRQERMPAQERPGHGPAPHRREGRKAAEVHGQDVEALQGEAPGGLDAPDDRRTLQARRDPEGHAEDLHVGLHRCGLRPTRIHTDGRASIRPSVQPKGN